MTSIGIEPWIVVDVHTLIVTQLCFLEKEACPEGRGAAFRLARIGEQAHLVAPFKTPTKLANAATREPY